MGKKNRKKPSTAQQQQQQQQQQQPSQSQSQPAYQALAPNDLTKKCNSVIEIYETQNFKQALRQLNTLIQRHGPVPRFVALQALVLERMGRRDEALPLLASVSSTVEPSDTECIQYIITTYKIMDRLNDLIVMFERCVASAPGDEDLTLKLFFTYGRAHQFDKQQRLAMQLYKRFKNDRYLYWAGVCMLQLYPTAGVNRMLQLSEMMIHRAITKIDDQSSVVPQDVQIYIHTLLQQEKHEQVLQVLQGPLVTKWRTEEPTEVQLMLVRVLMHLQQWAQVSTITYEFLMASNEENPNADDWEYWEWYIRAERELGTSAQDIRQRVQAAQALFPHLRGPWLAEFHVCTHAADAETEETIMTLTRAYFERFGHKPCFYFDVEAHVCNQLSPAKVLEVVDELSLTMNNDDDDDGGGDGADEAKRDAAAERKCRRIISLEQLRRFGAHLYSPAEAKQHAQRLYDLYNHMNQTLTANMEPTERGAGDDLIILCAYYLLDQSTTSSAPSSCMYSAIAALEYGVEKSPYNFQIRLLLIRLYCHPCVAAFTCALQHYEHLKIKQIQLDSMSHYLLNDAARYGHYDQLYTMCSQVSSFHRTHNEEGGELYVLAYRHHNYTKVIEFTRFAERLRASHQWAVARVERMYALVMMLLMTGNNNDTNATTLYHKHVHSIVKKCAELEKLPQRQQQQQQQSPPSTEKNDDDADDDEKKSKTENEDGYHYNDSARIDELVVNQDVSVLHYWGNVDTDAYQWRHRLNRPAPSTCVSSFDNDEWRDQWCAQGDTINTAAKQWLQFQHLWMATVTAGLDEKAAETRSLSNQLGDLVKHMTISITHAGWMVLLSETCACILTALHTSTGEEEEEDEVQTRWTVVGEKLDALTALLVAHHTQVSSTASATQLSHMLMYGGVWTCVFVQQWDTLLPRKRRKMSAVVSAAIGDTRIRLIKVTDAYATLLKALGVAAAAATPPTPTPAPTDAVCVSGDQCQRVVTAAAESARTSYQQLHVAIESLQHSLPTIQPERS